MKSAAFPSGQRRIVDRLDALQAEVDALKRLQSAFICHGLSRFVTALSRVQTHERPVFIDLSRCHGSRG